MRRCATAALAASLLAACGGGSDGADPQSSVGPGSNNAPTINGAPAAAVMEGSQYSFKPSAQDADGDALSFSVAGLPGWASFDASSGELSGTPGQGDVGSYANIRITVSDGATTASFGPFTIDVVATASGAVVLSWTAPTENTDGTTLTDLAGYKIYWGTSPDDYTESATLDNPGLTTYVVEQLTAGTWYFVATAFDADGLESAYSNAAEKTIL